MSALVWSIIILLIAVNALYVAAEFSAVSVRQSRVQQRADDGDALARRLLPVLRDAHALDRYVAGCQIGITLSSLVLGAYGQATLTPALGPLLGRTFDLDVGAATSTAAITVLVGLTLGQMILGELIPKSVALQFPTRIALWTAIPMQWSLRLFAWFIAVLNGSGTAILRALGMHAASGHRHIHSPEEIELLIAESRDGGLLEPDEHYRLRRALRLGIRTVDELMVPRPRIEGIPADAPADVVVRTVSESPFTRLPAYDDNIDGIVGFVHARDVAARALESDRTWSARTVMRPVLIVPQVMTADRVLARMREERRQLAIVVDEFGGTAGLVTVDDILDEVMGGDVGDERQPVDAVPERLPDGRIRVPGDMRVEEAAAWLGVEWEDGKAHTIGGQIMERLDRVPEPGDRLSVHGVQLEVERVRRHAVESVLATPAGRGGPTSNGSEVTRG
jgi:CBS domain containing-hemolysin-like protein